MQEHTHLIPAHSRAWDEWMRRVAHDVFHTRSYHAFSQACGEGEGYLAVHGTRSRFIAWPYLLRPIDDTLAMRKLNWYDITSVYGYSGPVVNWAILLLATLSGPSRRLGVLNASSRFSAVSTRFSKIICGLRAPSAKDR